MKLLVTLFIIKIFARINIEVLRCFLGLGVGKCVRLLADKFGQQVKSGSVPKCEKFVRYAFFNMQPYFFIYFTFKVWKVHQVASYYTTLILHIANVFIYTNNNTQAVGCLGSLLSKVGYTSTYLCTFLFSLCK